MARSLGVRKSLNLILKPVGFELHRIHAPKTNEPVPIIPDDDLYRPLFSPWLGQGEFRHFYEIAAPRTLVSQDRCYVIYTLLQQALRLKGDVWECGVYKGGTAAMMAAVLRDKYPTKRLYLFDTFEGMPETNADEDLHIAGNFSDTDLNSVQTYVGNTDLCVFRKGFIPKTFSGLESAEIAFAHIDVDIYQSIIDCLEFIWPRLSDGGFIIFDDYGFPTCPGARASVDMFFSHEKCVPLCLQTGQAIIFKGVV